MTESFMNEKISYEIDIEIVLSITRVSENLIRHLE